MSAEQIDHEARLVEDDHHSLKLWLRLLTCSSLVENNIRESLRQEFNTTLPRFDFMAQLQREPQGLVMGSLSKRMMVSGGNVSGIATQLVKDGLISRESLKNDRRTFVVKLTPKGLRTFNKMAARHEEWVIETIGPLGNDNIEQLTNLLGELKRTTLAAQSESNK